MLSDEKLARCRDVGIRALSYNMQLRGVGGDIVNVGDLMIDMHAEITRLQTAMREAIRLHEQPHYGDVSTQVDNSSDAIDILREALP